MPVPPSPSSIGLSTFQQALTLYPALVEQAYKSKLKDSKKVADALLRDRWRFDELPSSISGMKARGGDPKDKNVDLREGGLTKEAVERLVQWKM